LFHAESVLGFSAFRGFSLPVAATAFAAHCPLVPRLTTWLQGLMHLGDSFTKERFYPGSIGRSSLSIETLKEIPL
jgi:hypothetical protein